MPGLLEPTPPGRSPPGPTAPRRSRVPFIEGARGFASLWVLLFHSLNTWQTDDLYPALGAIRQFTSFGWLGVHIFFAISGWCIAERLATAYRHGESCRTFLRERALRIFPTYWAALALLLCVRWLAMPFNHTTPEQNFPQGAGGWMGNILLINPYLGTPPTLMVSWSLVYELGFYGLGAAALLLRRHGLSSAAIAAAGMLLCATPLLHFHSPAIFVFGLWSDFFAGALVWWCARSPTVLRTTAGVSGLAVLLALMIGWPGGAGALAHCAAVATAATLWWASRQEPPLIRGVLGRTFTWLGTISYSLYLVHVTVMSPFQNLVQKFIPAPSVGFAAVWIVSITLGISAGWLMYRFVEAPIEHWRKVRWARPSRPSTASPMPALRS